MSFGGFRAKGMKNWGFLMGKRVLGMILDLGDS